MCQVHDEKATKELRKRLKKRGWIPAWKALRLHGTQLSSIHFYATWLPGVHASDRPRKARTEREADGKTYHGNHVFLHRKDAEAAATWCYDKIIVPVKCHAKAFVDAGHQELFNEPGAPTAVFMQVELTERAYRKAMA